VSTVKFTPWTSRLSKIIKQPGGTTVRGALKDAKLNLEKMRLECVIEIDAKLGEIQQRFGRAHDRPADDQIDEFYRLSNDIVGTAGLFDLTELGEAAFSLCELLDRLKSSDQWDGPAIEIHLSALTLLRRATPDAPENQPVLEGLRKLTARVDARRELRKA
jgi:hypothetical protein